VEIFLNWQKLCTESSLSSVRKVTSLFVGLLSFFKAIYRSWASAVIVVYLVY